MIVLRFLALWILVCLLVAPFPSGGLADLTPAELLCLSRDGDAVLARCDGGLAARGASPVQAVENLRAAAPGRLELGTVDFAVLTDLPPSCLQDLALRPACAVYAAPAVEDPDALAVYLRSHRGGVTLGMLADDPSLPVPQLLPGETGLVLP